MYVIDQRNRGVRTSYADRQNLLYSIGSRDATGLLWMGASRNG